MNDSITTSDYLVYYEDTKNNFNKISKNLKRNTYYLLYKPLVLDKEWMLIITEAGYAGTVGLVRDDIDRTFS